MNIADFQYGRFLTPGAVELAEHQHSSGAGHAVGKRRLAMFIAVAVIGSATASWAAGITISQRDLRFAQTQISIHQGDTVTFSNNDPVSHNISVRGGASGDTEDLGIQKPNVSVAYRFTEKRTYSVVCSIHPKMRLKVVVD